MHKDSKINKSPIQSILHESFGHLPSSSVQHDNNDILYNERILPNSQFQISYQNSNINVEQQLKLVKIISITQLQICIDTICGILRNKIANKLTPALRKIKTAQLNKNAAATFIKSDKIFAVRKTHLFFQKIQSVINIKKLKILGNSYSQIYIYSIKNPNSEKTTSIVSPYRQNSKIQIIQRSDSEWQLAQSQGCIDSHQNAARQNRFLKKKKQKIKSTKEDFLSRMDQVLASHQAFLTRK